MRSADDLDGSGRHRLRHRSAAPGAFSAAVLLFGILLLVASEPYAQTPTSEDVQAELDALNETIHQVERYNEEMKNEIAVTRWGLYACDGLGCGIVLCCVV